MTTLQHRLDWTVQLRRDARMIEREDGVVTFQTSRRSQNLSLAGSVLGAAVRALATGRHSDTELTTLAIDAGGVTAAMRLQKLLTGLAQGGWLEHSLVVDATPLATLLPLGQAGVSVNPGSVPADQLLRLSRFTAIRAEGGILRAESSTSSAAVDLLDPRSLQLISLLGAGTSVELATATLTDLTPGAVSGLLTLFKAGGLLTEGNAELDPESVEQRLVQWSAPDLLLHTTSRFGRRNAGGYGGTYRLSERFPALPSQQPALAEVVTLTAPDLEAIAARDPSLTSVLESRRSQRTHDDAAPITVSQLGELLYRTVRIRRWIAAGGDELVDRPFPAGGSLHELEVYPVVSNCDGLAPGVWHYDGLRHAFERVADPSPAMSDLVAQARVTSLMDADPQVLLVVAARFGRVMWKYESMAYALILKHVGVLYQTLYLTATAMGLAPCAQGGGDADLFAAASGLDYYTEGSVGEFIIGSLAADAHSMWEAGET
jgi:oxazoline/thiazoline dehydrogenase